MVIQKESGGREAVVRARAQVLLRVHSGPTVTFPGPGPEEREREKNWRIQKLRVTKQASINLIKRRKCLEL